MGEKKTDSARGIEDGGSISSVESGPLVCRPQTSCVVNNSVILRVLSAAVVLQAGPASEKAVFGNEFEIEVKKDDGC